MDHEIKVNVTYTYSAAKPLTEISEWYKYKFSLQPIS